MRVALHFPDGSIAAYKLGRIVDGTHTDDLLTGKVTPVTDIADALAEQAKTEHPEATVVLERWKDNGDGTSSWIPVEETIESGPLTPSQVVDAPSFEFSQDAESAVN